MRVLLLGADGFIGRHIAFHLRDKGHEGWPSPARLPGWLRWALLRCVPI